MSTVGEGPLTVHLLGRFEVWHEGEPIPPAAWGRRKTQALLKVLLGERGKVFSRDALVDLLYPESDPERVVKNLRGRVSELRRALEPGLKRGPDSRYVLNVGQGYCFSADAPCWVDVEAFQQLLTQAQELQTTQRWSPAAERLETALALYRGDYLEEDPYEEWTLRQREHLQEQYLSGLEDLSECHLQLGSYGLALEGCEKVLQRQPYREKACRLKMRAHAHAGEQAQALQAYHACVNALKDHLGVSPAPETRALHLRIKAHRLPKPRPAKSHTLPAFLTSFVGRQEELRQLRRKLEDPTCRLLTVVGPGGIGKTRLAARAANEVAAAFPDGVFWVSLAALSAPALLPSAVAESLKFRLFGSEPPERQLRSYLREKRLLLVLDNFEHLGEAAGWLVELLQGAPRLTCLVTSRAWLVGAGEHVLALEGLPVARAEGEGAREESEAVALFLDRARRARPNFALTPQRRAAVERLCRRLEGVPLGLELAAAWVEVLSCEEILAEVERSLDFLQSAQKGLPERHRSVRATFESSWRLLSRAERGALRRLSVFRGGFARRAGEEVAGATLSLLSGLMSKSLVKRLPSRRYEVHGLVRQFCQEKLGEEPDRERDAQERHAAFFAGWLAAREPELQGGRQLQALAAIGAEIDNVRRAWDWMVAQRDPQLERCLEALYLFYDMRGWFAEGQSACAHAAAALSKERRLWARLRTCQGHFLLQQGQLDRAKSALDSALEACERVGDEAGEARALCLLGIVAENAGDYPRARRLLKASLKSCQAHGQRAGAALALLNLGIVAFDLAEYEGARRRYERSLQLCREAGDRFGQAKCLNNLGNLFYATDRFEAALPFYQESLAHFRALGVAWGEHTVLNNLGSAANALENYEEARRNYQESLRISRQIGYRTGTALALANLGETEHRLGNRRRARELLRQGLAQAQEAQLPWLILDTVLFLARQLHQEGQPSQAWELARFVAAGHPLSYMQREAARLLQEVEAGWTREIARTKARAHLCSLEEVLARAEELLTNTSE